MENRSAATGGARVARTGSAWLPKPQSSCFAICHRQPEEKCEHTWTGHPGQGAIHRANECLSVPRLPVGAAWFARIKRRHRPRESEKRSLPLDSMVECDPRLYCAEGDWQRLSAITSKAQLKRRACRRGNEQTPLAHGQNWKKRGDMG